MQKGTQTSGRHSNIHTAHDTHIPELDALIVMGWKDKEMAEAGRVAFPMDCRMMVYVERSSHSVCSTKQQIKETEHFKHSSNLY